MADEKTGIREIDAELQKLTNTLAAGKEKKIELVQFMQDCASLFEKVEGCMLEGDAREKELVSRKLAELGSALEGDIEELCKLCGKTEEEIGAYLENPDNYTSDAWSAIQRANRKIVSAKKRKRPKR